MLSATQLTKRTIINFKNFQGNETKSQSHQVRRTAAKQFDYVSVSYRFRIDLVSIPYRSRIVLLSFSYRSRFRNEAGQFLGLANIVGGVLKVEKLFVERN